MIPATEPVLRGPSEAYLNRRIARICGVAEQEITKDLNAVTPLVEKWCDEHDKFLEITRIPRGNYAYIVFISDQVELAGADVVFAQEQTLGKALASVLSHAHLHWAAQTQLE